MAPVQLQYVVSFTSQDDAYKANNLLSSEGRKKWLAHPKDRSGKIEIVFQLEEPCHFSYIDVGTMWCASLEVRVGRSDWPQGEEYKTLVPMVNLMSPIDCQLGRKTTSTSMFSKSNFSNDTCMQQWDRIQIIGRQPYRKDAQLGISFVRIRNSIESTSGKTTPGNKSDNAKRLPLHSASSIQRHFFGESKGNEDDYAENLKYKLLQMSNSSDNGCDVVHQEALSRTAQLVLKATEVSQNSTKHYKMMGKQTRRGLFSGSVIGKDHVKINEEIASFLQTLDINLNHLETITIADLRHKFERQKKRKLVPEEKRVFSSECQSYICRLVDQNDETEKSRCPSTKQDWSINTRLGSPQCISNSVNANSTSLSPHQTPVNARTNKTCKTSGSFQRNTLLTNSGNCSEMSVDRDPVQMSKNSPSTKLLSPACDSSSKKDNARSVSGGPRFKKIGSSFISPDKHQVVNSNGISEGSSSSSKIRPVLDDTRVVRNSKSNSTMGRTMCDSKIRQGKLVANFVALEAGNEKVSTECMSEEKKGRRRNMNTNSMATENKVGLEKRKESLLFHERPEEEEDDMVLCESNILYDKDNNADEVDSIISSPKVVHTSRVSPIKSSISGRTLQEVNAAYASLYPSADSLPTKQNGETSKKRASWKKNKKFSKNTMDLIKTFQCEISDEEEATTATTSTNTATPSFSPWLGDKMNTTTPDKTCAGVRALTEQINYLKKDYSQNGKSPRSSSTFTRFSFSDSLVSSRNGVNGEWLTQAAPIVNSKTKTFTFQPVCVTRTSTTTTDVLSSSMSNTGTTNGSTRHEIFHRPNETRTMSITESLASVTLCPFCDVLVPNETYDAHLAACVNSPMEIDEPIVNEASIDQDEDFGECPICLQRFQMAVLPVHASECGLF